jgi:hypothetical protein
MNLVGGFDQIASGMGSVLGGLPEDQVDEQVQFGAAANRALARMRGAQYTANAMEQSSRATANANLLSSGIGALGNIASSAVGTWIKQSAADRAGSRQNSGMDWGKVDWKSPTYRSGGTWS